MLTKNNFMGMVIVLVIMAPVAQARNIVGMAIDGTNNLVFTYYDDQKVSGGSSSDLSSKRQLYRYKLPSGKKPKDIVGMGIDGSNNYVFAWYRDGTVSAGSSKDLASKRKPKKYKLPSGKKPQDIIGMGIDGSNNYVVAWYRDGTVSIGTSTNLYSKRQPKKYTLPFGKKPQDIIGMGVDGYILGNLSKDLTKAAGELVIQEYIEASISTIRAVAGFLKDRNSLCFAWYRDGTVSAGKSTDLSEVRMPYEYTR